MPAKSKKQFKLMAAVAHGAKLKNKPKGLSKTEAAEFIKGNVGKKKYSKLPTKKASKKKVVKRKAKK